MHDNEPDTFHRKHVTRAQGAPRTGAVGRTVRLLLGALMGLFAYTLVRAGATDFRGVQALTSPGFWILTVLGVAWVVDMFQRFLSLPRVLRWLGPAMLAAAVLAAGLVTGVSSGSVWGPPLSDVVWWFDLVFLAYAGVTLLLAALIGTPGCEQLVWTEAVAWLRGHEGPPTGRPCLAGLHKLDEWERMRRTTRGGPTRRARQ